MYQLLALLLIPLIGSGLVFAFRNQSSKYLSLGVAVVQLLLTICILSGFDTTPTIDSALQYEINYPWLDIIKSRIHLE